MTADRPTVTRRPVYEAGRRPRFVYDATWRDARATAPTKREAMAAVRADVAFIEAHPPFRAHGFRLEPHGHESWAFCWPRGGSYVFSAPTFVDAARRVYHEYRDHEASGAFQSALLMYALRCDHHLVATNLHTGDSTLLTARPLSAFEARVMSTKFSPSPAGILRHAMHVDDVVRAGLAPLNAPVTAPR